MAFWKRKTFELRFQITLIFPLTHFPLSLTHSMCWEARKLCSLAFGWKGLTSNHRVGCEIWVCIFPDPSLLSCILNMAAPSWWSFSMMVSPSYSNYYPFFTFIPRNGKRLLLFPARGCFIIPQNVLSFSSYSKIVSSSNLFYLSFSEMLSGLWPLDEPIHIIALEIWACYLISQLSLF